MNGGIWSGSAKTRTLADMRMDFHTRTESDMVQFLGVGLLLQILSLRMIRCVKKLAPTVLEVLR